MQDPLEILWDQLLSRQPSVVKHAFSGLSSSEKRMVLDHLKKMAFEEGWQPGQRDSARAALEVIDTVSDSKMDD